MCMHDLRNHRSSRLRFNGTRCKFPSIPGLHVLRLNERLQGWERIFTKGNAMKRMSTLIGAITAMLAVAVIAPHAALADKPSPIANNPESQVKSECGGTFYPSTGPNGVYGCAYDDGHGIVCGGATKAQKGSCTAYLHLPPHQPHRLPTQSEIAASPKVLHSAPHPK